MKHSTLTSSPNSGNTIVGGIPQRTIKFRAWDGKYKKMHYKVCVGNVYDEGKNYTAHSVWIEQKDVAYKLENELGQWMNFDEHSNFALMQFTGMVDKLGNEIYEGDIVQTIGDNGEHLSKFKIYYGDCQFMKLREDGNNYGLESNQKYLQIIGNVFEGPELLG